MSASVGGSGSSIFQTIKSTITGKPETAGGGEKLLKAHDAKISMQKTAKNEVKAKSQNVQKDPTASSTRPNKSTLIATAQTTNQALSTTNMPKLPDTPKQKEALQKEKKDYVKAGGSGDVFDELRKHNFPFSTNQSSSPLERKTQPTKQLPATPEKSQSVKPLPTFKPLPNPNKKTAENIPANSAPLEISKNTSNSIPNATSKETGSTTENGTQIKKTPTEQYKQLLQEEIRPKAEDKVKQLYLNSGITAEKFEQLLQRKDEDVSRLINQKVNQKLEQMNISPEEIKIFELENKIKSLAEKVASHNSKNEPLPNDLKNEPLPNDLKNEATKALEEAEEGLKKLQEYKKNPEITQTEMHRLSNREISLKDAIHNLKYNLVLPQVNRLHTEVKETEESYIKGLVNLNTIFNNLTQETDKKLKVAGNLYKKKYQKTYTNHIKAAESFNELLQTTPLNEFDKLYNSKEFENYSKTITECNVAFDAMHKLVPILTDSPNLGEELKHAVRNPSHPIIAVQRMTRHVMLLTALNKEFTGTALEGQFANTLKEVQTKTMVINDFLKQNKK